MRALLGLIAIVALATGCTGSMTVPLVLGTRNHIIINVDGEVESSASADGGSKMGMPNILGE